jgi:hypothetical protein
MSGTPDKIDRLLFDVCSGAPSRKLFVLAWAKITEDDGRFCIEDIDWTEIMLGNWPEDNSLKVELQNIEPTNWEVTEPGCYIMRGLFDIKRDGDSCRSWEYLEEKIVEFDFMCTIDEHEKPETSFESIEDNNFFDLFNVTT